MQREARKDILVRGFKVRVLEKVKRRAAARQTTVARVLESAVEADSSWRLRTGHMVVGAAVRENVARGTRPNIGVLLSASMNQEGAILQGRFFWMPRPPTELVPMPWEARLQSNVWQAYEGGREVYLTFDEGVRFWRLAGMENEDGHTVVRLERHEPDQTVNARIFREVAVLTAGLEPAPAGTSARMIREDRDSR